MNGNAIIGQFGGPTSVINSSLCGLIQEGLKSKKNQKHSWDEGWSYRIDERPDR